MNPQAEIRQNTDLTGEAPLNPLITILSERLSCHIGVLSDFIVRKAVSESNVVGGNSPDRQEVRRIMESIMERVGLLVGKKKASEIERELMTIAENHFKEGDMNDQ